MRLIDADKLLEDFAERQNLDCSDGEFCDCFLNSGQEVSTEWWCVEDAVESAPTIDAAPVVHARWGNDTDDGYTPCTNCGWKHPILDQNLNAVADAYCPNCGAKMDAKEAES